jgi:ArsR family transcriptional regulator, arsenate/arsenite/antimonite-responsive transcriptional repressor
MAINKKSEFSSQDQHLADFAKVLSHPARIAILKVLAQKGVCICGEIVEVLPLAQSTVSQHLKDMKAAGIITGEVEGTKSCYCIDWNVLKAGCDAVQAMAKDLTLAKRNCC